jgi:hypothetical protein
MPHELTEQNRKEINKWILCDVVTDKKILFFVLVF